MASVTEPIDPGRRQQWRRTTAQRLRAVTTRHCDDEGLDRRTFNIVGMAADDRGSHPVSQLGSRIMVDGMQLSFAGRPFRVRGSTYGTFRSRRDGEPFPERARVEADFHAMRAAGLNVVRTYTAPPPDVLQIAAEVGLWLLVGVAFDDWRLQRQPGRAARRHVLEAGRRAVAEAMGRCAGHPAVMAVAVGNEVPGDVVRLHGIRAVEDVLAELVGEVHAADAGMLATYCSFPTTEYLQVEGQDLACVNVFLERPDRFRAYLRHLQIVSGELPLVLSELGLGSGLHGEAAQAASLAWQLQAVEEAGCAGGVVFSWTDEWAVAGEPVDGWGFGLTDAARRPKPALEAVQRWARASLRDLRSAWPRVSVVVCAYNEARLIEACLASLQRCEYPDLEVIVCDDGSTDATLELARRFPFRVIALPHGGLSVARNAGIDAATGEIVAFLDADAACHPEWPYRLALALEDNNVMAAGGPNLAVPGAGFVERAVGSAPGSPVQVLVSDDRAEHVPGCNMAFRRQALAAIGGFNPVYTSAGDDVDVCWRLLDRGDEIAFSPAAQVRHHRRASLRGYLKQQVGYGRAERMVSGAHRHRFKRLGRPRWSGFIYTPQGALRSILRPVIYHGRLGMAPFQGVTAHRSQAALGRCSELLPLAAPLILLGVLAPLSAWWLTVPATVLLLLGAYAAVIALTLPVPRQEAHPMALRALVGLLHVVQPLARAWGRLRGDAVEPGLEPGFEPLAWGDGDGDLRAAWLLDLYRDLCGRGCTVRLGGAYDWWDLEASIGPMLACRLATAVGWSWYPLRRLALRPRWLVAASLSLSVSLGVGVGGLLRGWGASLGALALALVAVSSLLEGWRLRRCVQRSLASTAAAEGLHP